MNDEDVGVVFFAATTLVAGACAVRFLRRARARAKTDGKAGVARIVLGNLLVLVFLASLACLGAESWFRFVYDSTDSFGILRTSDRWFVRHYRYNASNFRDDEEYDFGPLGGAAKRRVDFIGDSFTAGHGIARVSDRFAGIVRAARPQWQVHVFAQNGVDTGRQLYFVERELDEFARGRYACDVVVLAYCLNDIGDITWTMDEMLTRVAARRERGVASRYSYLFDWMHFLSIARDEPDVRGYFTSIGDAYDGKPWEVQRQRLRALNDAVKAHAGRLAVVTFPFIQDLGPAYRFRDVHRRLSEFWAAEGVPELNLFPVFEGHDAKDLVVGPYDAHPNERAHAMAAAAMLPFLDKLVGE